MRAFSPVTSHNFNQLGPGTCNWFCDSRIAGVTSQDFNTPFYGLRTVFGVKVDWAYCSMVSSRVVLGTRVVSQIVFNWFAEDSGLTLGCFIFEPIESHADGFGAFLFDSSGEDATRGDGISF